MTLNGSTVSEWRDKSGRGRHFSQSTASKQPELSTTYFSKGAVHFDGTDDVMSNQTASNWVWTHREATWLFAYRLGGSSNTKQTDVATILGTVEQYFNANPVGVAIWIEDRSGSVTDRGQLVIHNGGTENVYNQTWNDGSFPEATNAVIGIRYSVTGTKSSSWQLNGTARAVQFANGATASPSTGNPTFGLSIGANSHNNYAGARFGAYRIAEIAGWDRSLSDTELTAASNYMKQKWGLA